MQKFVMTTAASRDTLPVKSETFSFRMRFSHSNPCQVNFDWSVTIDSSQLFDYPDLWLITDGRSIDARGVLIPASDKFALRPFSVILFGFTLGMNQHKTHLSRIT